MVKNSGAYTNKFKQASKGNSVMKTALGVFTGFIAADLVTSAIHQHQLSEALSNFSTELENMGGIDNLQIEPVNSSLFTGNNVIEEEIPPSSTELASEEVIVADTGELEIESEENPDDSFDVDDDDFDIFS